MASNVTISRAITRLDQVKGKDARIRCLTKEMPYVFGTVDDDCRMAVDQYLHIVEGEYWKEVSDTPEEYFEKYCKHPVEWFNTLAEGIALLDQSQPIPAQDAIKAYELKNSKAPDNVRQKSPETIEKAKRAQYLRELGKTQQEIADDLGCTEGYVRNTLLRTDTSYNITSVSTEDGDVVRPKSRGTSKEYRKAKLRRDRPDLLAKVDEGDLSLNKAFIEAGWVKPKINLQIDPEESGGSIASKLYAKLTDEQMLEIRDQINELYEAWENG